MLTAGKELDASEALADGSLGAASSNQGVLTNAHRVEGGMIPARQGRPSQSRRPIKAHKTHREKELRQGVSVESPAEAHPQHGALSRSLAVPECTRDVLFDPVIDR